MANVTAPNLRGKGVSATKVTKNGEPKHAGNWSAATLHAQSMQYKDYYVRLIESTETPGIKMLIVGDHTPLFKVMGDMVENAAINDPCFNSYTQAGEFKGLQNGKGYEARRTLRKINGNYRYYDGRAFVMREEIYTDFDFKYNFPNY